jgi:hypothetical protein
MSMYSRYGYEPFGDTKAMLESNNDYQRRQGENAAMAYGRQFDQQEHEKGLQAAEQQRRAYDSETARQMGQQKMGVLSGLVSGLGGIQRRVM